MFQRLSCAIFVSVISLISVIAQNDSLSKDSLYLKAIEMTDDYNSSKSDFVVKPKVMGFLVRNANDGGDVQSQCPSSNVNSANPWNAQTPFEAIVVGAMNQIFRTKKR